MSAGRAIQSLTARLPLPANWGRVDGHLDEVAMGKLNLRLVGLHVRRPDGWLETVSAAEEGTWPIERAYMRLLEQVAVFEAREGRCRLDARPLDGGHAETLAVRDVFPASDAPDKWQYADESGIAAGMEHVIPVGEVKRQACFELVERDAVLRSWHGETPPLSVPCPTVHAALASQYEFRMTLFPQEGLPGLSIIGVFGLPRHDWAPVLMGFAAAPTVCEAFFQARRELLERYAYAAEPCEEPPPFVPSRMYHREVFQHFGSLTRLIPWLDGHHFRKTQVGDVAATAPYRLRVVDITPAHLHGKVHVAKALAPEAVPLIFGRPPESVAPSHLGAHPMA